MKRFALALGLLTAATLFAAEPKPVEKKPESAHAPAIVDPEQAGPDYQIQGEYEGTAGSAKWGAQVIAWGDGSFQAVFEPGGLPGAGWDGKTRYESIGKTEGDKVLFAPTEKYVHGDGHKAPELVFKPGFTATIAGDTLTGKTDAGEEFTLKHTVRHSPTEGAKAPAGAIVLFDGSNVEAFSGTELNPNGTLKQGGTTKQKFTDFTLHVEFYLPFMPTARGQARGNSGVYLQNKYETQVLDSFALKGMDNECAGIYTKGAPSVNMCYPPLTWQTYDIEFAAARYEGGVKKSKAIVSVTHNGVLVQDKFEIDGSTGGGQKEDPTQDVQSGPIYLQNHGNPVAFRNVWIVAK
jgi:hypothetical protein